MTSPPLYHGGAKYVRPAERLRLLVPGIVLAAAVGAVSVALAPVAALLLPIPAIVLALLVGIIFNPIAKRSAFAPGLAFCAGRLLRVSVALLGLRVALGDITALGFATAGLVMVAMAATVASGFLLAWLLRLPRGYGALTGAGTAVCGASAALATAMVLPAYPGKDADVVFVVVAVNALSTLAMVVYPPLCLWAGLDAHAAGVLIGGSIYDVAQVVGAGYAVSDQTGNTAVIVKLFRVFLLLPVVLGIGWQFAATPGKDARARVAVPVFAFVFLLLCLVNSAAPMLTGAAGGGYAAARSWLIELSTDGMLVAIAALGLGTSLAAIGRLGWRHILTVCVTTLVILAIVSLGIALLGTA